MKTCVTLNKSLRGRKVHQKKGKGQQIFLVLKLNKTINLKLREVWETKECEVKKFVQG